MRASSSRIASMLKFAIISFYESYVVSGSSISPAMMLDLSSSASVSLELTGEDSSRPAMDSDFGDTIASPLSYLLT